MALTQAELAILLRARDEASAVLGKVNKELGATEQQLSKVARVSETAKVAMGAFAGLMGSVVVGALADAARAAAEEQVGIVRLQQAIENTGISYAEDLVPAMDQAVVKAQELAFADDKARDALSTLTAATGNARTALELLPQAMDLARGKGIDLATASEIVGKVAAGNTGILTRYGIVLKEGATATEALAAIQQKFGGQAERFGGTTQASIDRVRIAIDNWREDIGAALGPAQGFIALLPGISAGMSGASTAVAGMLPLLRGLSVTMLHTVIPAVAATVVALGPIILIVGAVALAAAALWFAWENNFLGIRDITANVIGFLTGLFETFGAFFTNLWGSLPGPVQRAVEGILAPLRLLIDVAKAAIEFVARATGGKISIPSLPAAVSSRGSLFVGGRAVTEQEFATMPFAGRFQTGGLVPRTGLALVHAGERVVPPGQAASIVINVNVGGSVIGILDFEDRVRRAVRDGVLAGGFRGVLEPAR